MAAWVADTGEIASTGQKLIDAANSNDQTLSDYVIIMDGLTDDQWGGLAADSARAKIHDWSKLSHQILVDQLRNYGQFLLALSHAYDDSSSDTQTTWGIR